MLRRAVGTYIVSDISADAPAILLANRRISRAVAGDARIGQQDPLEGPPIGQFVQSKARIDQTKPPEEPSDPPSWPMRASGANARRGPTQQNGTVVLLIIGTGGP